MLDLSAHSAKFGLESEVLGFGGIDAPDNPLADDRIHSLPKVFPKLGPGQSFSARE
ncbi:MAG: hypothetical protein ABSH56_13600 [Bryobacteraceae bacterium]